jgi:hypothetical protein
MTQHDRPIRRLLHLADTIAVKLRCCADPTTDSVHTIEVSGDQAEADLQAWRRPGCAPLDSWAVAALQDCGKVYTFPRGNTLKCRLPSAGLPH